MSNAVRMTDRNPQFDLVLPPCAPTVLINMLPAARETDIVMGANSTSAILAGNPTVVICFLPAAHSNSAIVGTLNSTGAPVSSMFQTYSPDVHIGI